MGMRGRPAGSRLVDPKVQKAENAAAPKIADLGQRILSLFGPYRAKLILTGVMVIVSAALGVVPALIIERIFDDALFPLPAARSCLCWSSSSC